MNAKTRRTRQRTEADVEVVKRTVVDPRGVCVKCYAVIAPKANHCDRCKPKEN